MTSMTPEVIELIKWTLEGIFILAVSWILFK